MTHYRVRFVPTPGVQSILGSGPVTAIPGIIKNNKPKALSWLRAHRTSGRYPHPEAWLEVRLDETRPWRKYNG